MTSEQVFEPALPRKFVALGLTFDDVLLLPARSDVMPRTADVTTILTHQVPMAIPLISAAMDTVTEGRLAIALAQEGGIGIIHKNLDGAAQAAEVDKVKRSESGMIVDPITMAPHQTVQEALEVMARYRISGIPITQGRKLVGILTNRDLRFVTDIHQPIEKLMTKEHLITVSEGTSLDEAQQLLAGGAALLDVRIDHGALGRLLQVHELRHHERLRVAPAAPRFCRRLVRGPCRA